MKHKLKHWVLCHFFSRHEMTELWATSLDQRPGMELAGTFCLHCGWKGTPP